jgi:opacity protein-like surface antigen
MRKTAMAASAVLALALAPASALAQEDMSDEMSGDDMMMGSMVPHPAHIHAGECPGVGDVVAPLNDVTVVGNEARGAEDHIHVDYSLSTVELTLDDILAADHAINVHQSADDMGTYIACGNIGGHDVDGSFLVGLGPVGDSGYSGIAYLTDNGDGTTDVQVAISFSGATEMMAMDDDMDDMSDDDMSDDDDMEDDS